MKYFLLTSSSISYLALLILCVSITGYFLYSSHKFLTGEDRTNTLLLAGSFGFLSVTTLLFFFEESFFLTWNIIALYFESFFLSLALILFLQFAYRYPTFKPDQKVEARIALIFSIFYSVIELVLVIWRLLKFSRGHVTYRPEYADYLLITSLFWLLILFARKTISESHQLKKSGWVLHLLKPQGRIANTTRAFLILGIFGLFIGVFEVVRSAFEPLESLHDGIVFLGLLFIFYFFTIIYINYFPEMVSIRIRLVGASLATSLAIFGVTAAILFLPTVDTTLYPKLRLSGRSLHFYPNIQNGYDVSFREYDFQDMGGDAVEEYRQPVNLPFDFPFYGQAYSRIFISHYGLVNFDDSMSSTNLQYNYGPAPAIFALYYPAEPVLDDGNNFPDTKITYLVESDQVVITWSLLPEENNPSGKHAFQLILYPSGAFDILYKSVEPNIAKISNLSQRLAWFSGATPGNRYENPAVLDFTQDVPFVSKANTAVLIDIKYLIRTRQNLIFSPFISILLVNSLVILGLYHLNFEESLIAPVQRLMSSMEKIKAGDYSVNISTEYQDELGTIAQTFNNMVNVLKDFENSKDAHGQKLSSTIEQSPSAVMILNDELLIEYVNPAFEVMTGYARHEVLSYSPTKLASEKTLPEVYQQLWVTIQSGEVWRGELSHTKKDGEVLWVFSVISPIRNSFDKINHYVWMMEDFTTRKNAEDVLQQLAVTDPLTGIYNRRQLFALGEKELKQAIRYGSPLCVLMIDVDHFKVINDQHGHKAGDQTLQALVEMIGSNIRGADIFGRYGGEEFLVLMPNADLNGTLVAAEHLRSLIAEIRVPFDKKELQITISIGICKASPEMTSLERIVHCADQALYNAKKAGRNQVAVYKE